MVQPLGQPGDQTGPERRPLRRVPAGEDTVTRDLGRSCSCGHGKQAHDHYRRGSDCSLCPCQRYRRPLLQRLGLRSA
jgi:hypothetical protein